MGKSILLILTENFDDMMFLSAQVILEEYGHDVIICSHHNGTAKGKNSSVMTVALSDALDQKEEYAGIVLIEGSDLSNWETLKNVLNQFNSENKVIAFSVSSKDLIDSIGLEINQLDGGIIQSDNLLYLHDISLAESFTKKFHTIISD